MLCGTDSGIEIVHLHSVFIRGFHVFLPDILGVKAPSAIVNGVFLAAGHLCSTHKGAPRLVVEPDSFSVYRRPSFA